MQVIETDNFGGDYPNERCVQSGLTLETAQKIAKLINGDLCNHPSAPRYWQVRPDDYQLQPGFEP